MAEKTQNIVLISLLTILLVIQLYWILRNKNTKRKYTKLILNILLWISFLILIFPPTSKNTKNQNKIGIKDDKVSDEFVTRIKDSLDLKTIVSSEKYEKEYLDKNQEVKLIGQSFEPEFLSLLSNKKVDFYPDFEKNILQNLIWRGVLYQNETQEVNGLIDIEKSSIVKLQYGGQTLDSMKLDKGKQSFSMSFPSFSLGKTSVNLSLNGETINELKYYSRPAPKLKILVLSEYPDFETKILSEWLGKEGHSVNVETIVSKSTQNRTTINPSKNEIYNLVFSTPSRSNNPICSKTLRNGGAVFIYNLSEKDVPIINKLFSENFVIQQVSSESELKLSNDLVGIPFAFKENKNQQKFKAWPIAISKKRVGLSLISETYPLMLSGDTITYRKIWGNVLQFLQPIQKNNVEIQSPILQNQFTTLKFNNFETSSDFFLTKNDTIFTKKSPINTDTRIGKYVFRQANWQRLNDSLEIFVNEVQTPNQYFQQTKTILNSYNSAQKLFPTQNMQASEILPDWLRMIICMVLFIAVWVEAKL